VAAPPATEPSFEREHDDARSNTRTHSRLSKRKADDVNYNKENELKKLIMYAEERFQKRSDIGRRRRTNRYDESKLENGGR
jgi:hypothetical protein